MKLHKYPRTYHLQGSRLQPGDEDLESAPWSEVLGRYVVAEEKLDGANAALSFDTDGKLWLQSRGHYLAGGRREVTPLRGLGEGEQGLQSVHGERLSQLFPQ